MYIISNYLGKFLFKEDDRLYKFRSLFGFALLTVILELLYLPLILMRESAALFRIITLVILGGLFIVALVKTKREDFFFLKSWQFYVLLVLVFLVFRIFYPLDIGDDSFYIPFIRDLAKDPILSIDPRTGLSAIVNNHFIYQGYYYMLSALNNLISSKYFLIFLFRSYMSFVYIIFLSILLKEIKTYFNLDKAIHNLLSVLAILVLSYLGLAQIYLGSYVLYPIFIPLYILAFQRYIRKKNNTNLALVVLVNISMIFFSSTALIFSSLIAFSFFIYDSFKEEVNIFKYYLIILPNLIYLLLLFDQSKYLYFAFLLLLLLFIVNFTLSKLLNRYLKYLVVFIPFILAITADVFDLNYSWASLNLSYYSLFISLFLALSILYISLKMKLGPIPLFLSIYIYLFFNPLSYRLIAHLIGVELIHKLSFIIFNPLVLIISLASIWSYSKKYHLIKYLYLVAIVIALIFNAKSLLDKSLLHEDYPKDYSILLRSSKDDLNLAKRLPDAGILSYYFQARIYNDNSFGEFYSKRNREESLSLFLSDEEYYNEETKNKTLFYDYIITFNKEKLIKKLAPYEIVYQNNTYVLMKKSQ